MAMTGAEKREIKQLIQRKQRNDKDTKPDMSDYISEWGGVNLQIFGAGPSVSFKRDDFEGWQDIGKVLGLCNDAQLEEETDIHRYIFNVYSNSCCRW